MVNIYGTAACRATQRAIKWMQNREVSYRFSDLLPDRVEKSMLEALIDSTGWQTLIDKRTAAWRNLPADVKQTLCRDSIQTHLLHSPFLLKTPILHAGPTWIVGWNAPNKIRLLGQLQHDRPSQQYRPQDRQAVPVDNSAIASVLV